MGDNKRDNIDKKAQKIEARRRKLQEQAAAKSGKSAAGSGKSAAGSGDAAARPVKTSASKDAGHGSKDHSSAEKRPLRFFNWKVKLILILIAALAITSGGLRLREYINRSTDIELTDEGYTHAERFKDAVALNGIDVSVHQGEEINWDRVKSSGADFVFVRAGYRSADKGTLKIDSRFEENMSGAVKSGLMTGAYFYSQALTPSEAEEEADFLLELVKPYDVTMPLVIDFEIYPDGRLAKKIEAGELAAASLYHDIVLAFCRRVESAGYESAVYANLDMLTHYMQADLLDDSATIWLAQYGETSDLEADYWFWQCGDGAKVGGIKGKVDHDYWYIEPGKAYPTRAASRRSKDQVSIGSCKVYFNKDSYKLSLRRAVPKISIASVKDGRRLRKGADYVVSYVHNQTPGTGYAIIRGIGLYKDWIAVPFTIDE